MNFKGKSVLVTGGTGSFGKKFIRTILDNYPEVERLIVFSRDELKQFEMQQTYNAPCMRYFIGDVRDSERMMQAMKDVDFVIHAAAQKQVPAAEYNPMECIKTNIHGAENVINAAFQNNVKKVIGLSTDKAAIPINLYGATKLASDKLFISANNMKGTHPTRFSVVRYGNVASSRGSVLPYFKNLLEKGTDHLPITHPDMTRFWITLQQGVDFVIKAFERMYGGEIFVPKLPSIRIPDLATSLAPDLEQKIIGIRPGEKIHETMCPSDSAHLTLDFEDHYVIKPSIRFAGNDDFVTNPLGEKGKGVADFFEYSSGTNPHFLSVEEIREFNNQPDL